MNIYVLVKQVPDTETRIKVQESGIDESGIKWIISPFDEQALEEGLRLKEKSGGSVTALSLGPQRTVEALRNAYALGVDHAVHIKDEAYNVFDVSCTAAIISSYLKQKEAQIILTGHIAIDSQSSMVPAMVAEYLECANINNAVKLELEGDKIRVRREIEGGLATMESALPVVITATKSLNDPRYPSLKGIMASKKKEVETVEAAPLMSALPKIELVTVDPPPPRPSARIIEGASAEEKAAQLVKALREEAKVI